MKIHLIAAARPNFMKVAPLYHELQKHSWNTTSLVHTGQHYDVNMSDSFFEDLNLPKPDFHLGVGKGSHAEQTGNVMIHYEKLCREEQPDLVVVVGDVNSTAACTLAAVKLGVPVAHLEAGLRSFDREMPEEINRLVTDVIADVLWTPSADGDENLLKEGIPESKIERVGNIMIDSLEMIRDCIEAETVVEDLSLNDKSYGIVTLHRPSNVDDPETLKSLCELLRTVCEMESLVFPLHPRTKKSLEKHNLLERLESLPNLTLSEPLPYRKFMRLLFSAKFVLTDSGGIQEETTYLKVPCLTLRDNTERPVTVELGTNTLVSREQAADAIVSIAKGSYKQGQIPELWDGKTASRVVESIERRFLS